MKVRITETQHKKMLLNQVGKVIDEPKDWFGKLYEWTSDPVLKGTKDKINAYDKDGKYLGYYDKESDFGYIVSESWSPELEQDLEAFHGEDELFEDKEKNKLCARGIASAKAKYDVYPSAYANGHAVQVCKGTIKGLDGKKKCSGSYCKGKNESVDLIDEDLAVWFGTKKKKKGGKQPQGPWVNICKKKSGGGHPECGRDDADKGGYPVCRAKSVAANMSQKEKDSACSRKRDKEKNDGKSGKGQSPSPIKVKGYKPKSKKK
jgi:hypothetical protein